MIENRNLVGGINYDDTLYDIAKGFYLDASCITKNDVSDNNDLSATNVIGNQNVPYTLPAGTNVTIGAKADVLRNRVYEFIWNSENNHLIVIYDNTTRTRTKLIQNLTDTSDIDVLQFSRYNKIIHVDIIYRDPLEGDLLFWTDGVVSPRKCNVKHIQDGIYTTIKVPFIEMAKMPPRKPALVAYGTDTTRNSNSLRKKLVMVTYRYSYDDYEKSTFTTYSKIPLPIGYYGSDNDIDSTKNNFITITIQTGDENVTDIEIAVRFNSANNWGDYVLVITLNKAQLGLTSNSTYDYLFYNDGVYPPLDVEEVIQLFDWVPQKANAQVNPNGDVIAYGGITEDFDNYPQSDLDVTITAENKTNIPPDTDPPSLTYIVTGPLDLKFTVGGSVPTGTEYIVYLFLNGNPGAGESYGIFKVIDYTSVLGDTPSTVVAAMSNQVNTYSSTPHLDSTYLSDYFTIHSITTGNYVVNVVVVPGSSGGDTISTEKTWLWDSNYIFGLAYKDDQGRIMPGVTTFVNPVDSDNDFLVTTPSFSLDGSNAVQTPVISASINHLPPAGAVTYAWVRRRMTYGDFLMYETCDYQDGSDGFLYLCLANIEKYKADNTQFIYGTAPITSESRIKIIAGVTSGLYDGDIWNQDYEILGTVTRTLTGGTSPDDDRLFIKIKKPVASISPAYKVNMLVMVYTPMANPTSIADSVYWEWGEEYPIYELDGVNYHRGQSQDQTASQPALFVWPEGDVYFHTRIMDSILVGLGIDTLDVMDSNWSDFFNSAVNDNGRGLAIEVNGRKTYFPATIRFGLEYQQSTNINQTNRFKYQNFIDLDRSFGDIFKMSIMDRFVRVGQRFKIGSVPIFNQISKDSANSTILASTDILLNPVQYYEGNYGVGEAPEAWVDYGFSSYFFDTNRGIWCRLSRDGITPISVLYKINSWATVHGVLRKGDYKIYGCYDSVSNNCIFSFEATDTDAAATWAFDENNNVFESRLPYQPEMMVTLGKLLITFKNGQLYTHDSVVYNRFYGIDYPSYIKVAFNQNSAAEVKSFLSLEEKATGIWECPEITTSVKSYGTTPQQSNLIVSDFDEEEGRYIANFKQDVNSIGGLINGDDLKGSWIIIKFQATNAQSLITLNNIILRYLDSPLTNR